MHLFWLPFKTNQYVQPFFKNNQFFFEFSKLTMLIVLKTGDPNGQVFSVRGAPHTGDPNRKIPRRGRPFYRRPPLPREML